MDDIDNLYGEGKKIMIDIKGLLNRKAFESAGYTYWRL
jgi:UDP-N-acetyl-D-galactosamine dehydrogenase